MVQLGPAGQKKRRRRQFYFYFAGLRKNFTEELSIWHEFNPRTSSVQNIVVISRTRTDYSIKLYINQKTMEPLNIGDTELRNHGTMEPWNHRAT